MNRNRFLFHAKTGIAALSIAITIACMTAGNVWLARLLAVQPGPTWIRLLTGFTVSSLVMTLLLLGATLLFGRFFCAVLCPLGVTQDAIGALSRRRSPDIPNPRYLRYILTAMVFVGLVGGYAIGFRIFEPFSRFGGMVAAVIGMAGQHSDFGGAFYAGLLPLFVLISLVQWKKRIYCVSLCPVGTVLGLFAKYGVFRLRMSDSCTGCGLCEKRCPTGCINSGTKIIDSERCVLCLRCLSACPRESISYSRKTRKSDTTPVQVDTSRRKFLLLGSTVALGMVAARYGIQTLARSTAAAAEYVGKTIFPPGAGDPTRFTNLCTSCQVCTNSCPVHIIKPDPDGMGPVRLDFSHSGCRYDCTVCNSVCPTGALQPLTLRDKQRLKIGSASVDLPKCSIVKDGVKCTKCEEACPKHAIFITPGSNGIAVPEVMFHACIGCGACRAACPAHPKAIDIITV